MTGMVAAKQKRVRKSPEERRSEIAQAAVRLVGEKGYYGTSLKDVAAAVGMSQPGLLHYIGNKEGLLSMLVTDSYDASGTPDDFMASGLPGSDPDRLLFPSYLRYLVRYNAQRREMVRLYMNLESEAFSPEHPLFDYFENRPEAVWDHYCRYPWVIPEQLGSWEESMKPVVRLCIEAMDGVQLRWMRQPPVDLYDEWLNFEAMIFPSPLWDNYR
ncbi:TetR-type transcriptional regulator [Bifidobacterium cebidarum]|uniref:TetR-type transcriptional regulator n=2 Tax=Bifidobacterium cebidarum TaxID=2650773 RepID=A0A6I1GC45_9BIFI|nr:TetR-type transcriptional regulator [Bifidobacterium cebidarum]